MAKIQVSNYTFNHTAKTVTFTDFTTIRLDRILLIENVTTNTLIYVFADATRGGSVATNVLTLTYDTSSGMADTDKLLIFYETGESDLDTGAGKDLRPAAGLLVAKSGGSVPVGDTQPLPVSVSGVVPISGPVQVTGTVSANVTGPILVTGPIQVTGTVSANVTGPILVTGPIQVTGTVSANVTGPILVTGPIQVTGTVSANVTGPILVTGPIQVTAGTSATGAFTGPAITGASSSVLASNAARMGASIYNEGTSTCFLKLGATASTTSYTVKLNAGDYYEVPFRYTGAIDAIAASGTAQLRVEEFT